VNGFISGVGPLAVCGMELIADSSEMKNWKGDSDDQK
jgi:hypothetical protein